MFHPSHLPVALTSNNRRTSLFTLLVPTPLWHSFLTSLPPFFLFLSFRFQFKPSRFFSCYACSPPLPDFSFIPVYLLILSPSLFQYPFLSTYRYYPLCHEFFLSILFPSCTIYLFHTVSDGTSSINQTRPTMSYGLLPRSRR